MNRTLIATALTLSLGFGLASYAQSPPVGGPDAKGNAPLKHMHTINDGSAKPGANSFTEGQARQHILNSGYSGVSGLAKGQDGVWRGTAMHDGAQVNVAMDFKGNVTEAGGGGASAGTTTSSTASTSSAEGAGAAAGGATARTTHPHMMRHRHHHHHGRCADPGPNGAACSGVDTNGKGVSDKEDRAIQSGAHP